ncbi:transposase family protein [Reyranella sp.]|uniref:integrase catalytic domain-containing protein n=1 Tax=Reyranella sp. TaxID=1929291 RepID=UPI002730010E|nr:transposase family protein [Reyranella sp.]MDP2374363.1 transposase family protein [Reyranella sp.]
MDFVHDTLVDGRKIPYPVGGRRLPRETLCLLADTSRPAARVIRELKAVIAVRGMPRQCVSDNGPEFASLAMLRRAEKVHLDWRYIDHTRPV